MVEIERIQEMLDAEGIKWITSAKNYIKLGEKQNYKSTIHKMRKYYAIYATDSDYNNVINDEGLGEKRKIIDGDKHSITSIIENPTHAESIICIRNGNRILHSSAENYIPNQICIYTDESLYQVVRILIDNYDDVIYKSSSSKMITKDVLDQITRFDVIEAIRRWDKDISIDPRLKKESHKPRKFPLFYYGKNYPSKVIFAIAYNVHYGENIYTDNLNGGDKTSNTVASHLLKLGFEVGDIKEAITPLDENKYSDNDIEEHAKSLTLQSLMAIAISQSNRVVTKTISTVSQISRSQYIAQFTKERADGKCQLCNNEAPFLDKKGEPYLESHHIIWLKNGGADSVDNTVALCPNCHRKMHILNDPEDVEKLKKANKKLLY